MIDTEEISSGSPNADRRVAFLSGVARSGTTAAVHLLNKHPEVALGIERFKFTFLRDKNPDGQLFDRERFFAFDANETNLLPEASPQFANEYEILDQKYDGASVVGDKIPNLAQCYRTIVDLFPDVRIIHMVREPTAVADSWDRRAQNSADVWAPAADAAKGVQRWLFENTQALDFRRDHPENILLVAYEGFFSEDSGTLDLIFEFLGVGPATPHQQNLRRAGAKRTNGKKFTDLGAQPHYIEDEQWAEVEDLMPLLQNHVRPKLDTE